MIQNIKTLGFILILSMVFMGGCSNADDTPELEAKVTVNGTVLWDDGNDFNGDVDGDFT